MLLFKSGAVLRINQDEVKYVSLEKVTFHGLKNFMTKNTFVFRMGLKCD